MDPTTRCVCANRRRAEWAPLSVVCDESYSAWLWPEAAIGYVINQELWMSNERLQHWNQKRSRFGCLEHRNGSLICFQSVLVELGGGRLPPPSFCLWKFAVRSHVHVAFSMQSETWITSLYKTGETSTHKAPTVGAIVAVRQQEASC